MNDKFWQLFNQMKELEHRILYKETEEIEKSWKEHEQVLRELEKCLSG